MKLHLKNTLLLGGVLLGLALALLPLILSRAADASASAVTAQYVKTAEQLGEDQAKKMLAQADRYNAALRDAFPEAQVYNELLRITDDGMMGYVEIPKINVELPIYHGTGSEALSKGVGHLAFSSLPVGGAGTHAALSAHSGMAGARGFSDLALLDIGDCFTVRVLGRVLTYKVDNIATVLPIDASKLAIDAGQDYCTLITCVPYGINTHRLLVRGRRIETPTAAEQPMQKAEAPQGKPVSVWTQNYLLAVGVGTTVGLATGGIAFCLRAKRRRH